MKHLAVIAAAALTLAACTTDPYTGEQKLSNAAIGSTVGAGLGALTGLAIGKGTSASSRKATLIGAGIGALAGAGVGAYVDNQEAALRQRLESTGVSVTRAGDDIILNMPSNITFDFGRSEIKPHFYDVLNSVALVLNEYDRSIVDVNGHTDNVGSHQSNQVLSEKRAESVAEYLSGQQVDPRRLAINGYGESSPVAANDSDVGRARNRRVEIRIVPLTQG